ncbi:type III PLP-dependent enzyme [Aestuariirhabdus litorea]|uniref:ornithine decarboxylase n=1 Tax=Aestuariirhabdus litorea TaxID=2528527 RepID=A0A3P3VP51_9GAMM|nr:type III PLP-dependent enzyme [Aestuariirhabdus litorea]RRJ84390.1 type III PLP-dependent enzyme [Aestuariirhabdus litorea]RWW97615.1 type III PLP-dependent enzyme [Endozoicomonadaceae bacterium GTF-13]
MSICRISPAHLGDRYRSLLHAEGSAVLLLNLSKVTEQYRALCNALPGVEPYYAIKSLPHPAVVEHLLSLGCGLDIATAGEIEMIRDLPVDTNKTIHTHPIKRPQDIRAALNFGVTTFVVDNIWELEKFIPFAGRVELLLRISYRNPEARVDLSRKFGCTVEEAPFLLQRAEQLGIRVKGLSFHVGSQSKNGEIHAAAIRAASRIMQEHNAEFDENVETIDIGGGFPVNYGDNTLGIEAFCAPIREALAELPAHFRVLAEPGRFLSAPAGTAITQVMGKARRGDTTWYYLNDGVYGSFSGQIYDHTHYPLEVFSDLEERETAALTGPTCDSIDMIAESIVIPPLQIGDIVVGHMMGAYTMASASDFNLFDRAHVVVMDDDQWAIDTVTSITA